ncbi:MAG: hypothetical protein QCH31_11835 [Methanolobus sp.]|nr:hypothetical protein [Methanolobus sp.]
MSEIKDTSISSFVEDLYIESIILKFIDSKLYPGICSQRPRWYHDSKNQDKGIDCDIFFKDLEAMSVDVKCAHDYVKTNVLKCSIPTFAFELSYFKGREEKEGWLYDKSKETAYYLLCWIWTKKEEDFKLDDILKLECCLIERQKILYYLATKNLYPEEAREINRRIRASGKGGKHFVKDFPDIGLKKGLHFNYSKDIKAEGPINIIIFKDKFMHLATKHFFLY